MINALNVFGKKFTAKFFNIKVRHKLSQQWDCKFFLKDFSYLYVKTRTFLLVQNKMNPPPKKKKKIKEKVISSKKN